MKSFTVRAIDGTIIYCGRCLHSAEWYASHCASLCSIQYPDGRIVTVCANPKYQVQSSNEL